MKVLIFGAGGQVAQALVRTAPAHAEVTALSRRECDVSDPAAVMRAVMGAQPQVVFNAAAYTAVDAAETDAQSAHATNAVAAGQIAAAAKAAGARLVHLSTDFVFGDSAGVPLRPHDRTNPQGVYAATKLEGERRVIEADASALIVRTAWVYDAEGRNFVNSMLRIMRERPVVRVVADQVGTPTWAPSLAAALWELVDKDARGIHHFTDAGVASWYDFAIAIAEEALLLSLLPRPVEVEPITTAEYPTPAKRPSYSVLDKSETWALLTRPPAHWRVNLRRDLLELNAND